MKPAIKIFILLFLVSIAAGCGREPIRQSLSKSMAELDRAYIPAIFFMSLQKQRESEIALKMLKAKWKEFDQKYYELELKYGIGITDKLWKDDFRAIDTLISSVEGRAAAEKLTAVREILKELRHRHGLDYYLDKMIAFNNATEEIIKFLNGKKKLSETDLGKLQVLSKKAQKEWATVSASRVDAKTFGFDLKKPGAIKKLVEKEQKSLAKLDPAIDSKDLDQIAGAIKEIKANFMLIYRVFGDFNPVFEKIRSEKRKKI